MEKSDKNRLIFLKVCMILAFSVITARLFVIQIIDHDEYVAKAASEHIQENVLEAERGEIYMLDNGEPVKVVMNETVYTVVFDPMVADEEEATKALEMYAKDNIIVDFRDVFHDKTRRYYVVARNVKYEEAKKIEKMGLAGVSFEKTNKRVYPEGEMASEVLGFVNLNGDGQYGVEGAFDKQLSGTDGSLKAVRDVNGIALSIGDENVETPAVDGEDVILTIDRNIQAKTEEALARQVANSTATNGAAIVMNPNTGEVLAMANVPNYDPANYGNVKDAGAYINHVLEDVFEPASVCKTFTYAAGVDLGLINRDTTYYNTKSLVVDGVEFSSAYDGFRNETISFQTALLYSLNVGSSHVLELMGGGEYNEEGRKKLYGYLMNFGLGQYTGIELYEQPGFVPSPNQYEWTMNFTYANMTFGQGMSQTMLQLAAAYSAVVNGGKYYAPTIVAGEFDKNGYFQRREYKSVRNVISESASAEMRQFLIGNRVWDRALGKDRNGYDVGGKTGTGQVVKADGSYSDGAVESLATYAGWGGTAGEIPEYVMIVRMWADGQAMKGNEDAQPVFDEVSNWLIDYLKIRPKM